MKRVLRAALLTMIVVLYGISIPWYRADESAGHVLGLPDWVAVALGCYVVIAVLNAIAWWLTDIPDPEDDR